MRVKKLKRSLLCFAMVFCIVFSLCGCKEEEISIDDMPEIVFVKFNWRDDEFKGEYIDKEGYVRSFEITEENDGSFRNNNRAIKSIRQFGNTDAIKKADELIMQNFKNSSNENIVNKIGEEEMKSYYEELLKVNTNKRLKIEGFTVSCAVSEWYCIYGKKKNNDNEEEIVFIREAAGLTYCFVTKEKHADNLFWDLADVFTKMEPSPKFGW